MARAAWSDWWGWDPKELWSLASWLVYAVYFHVRARDRDERVLLLDILLILGFAAIVITLTWVNLSRIFAGVHSYA